MFHSFISSFTSRGAKVTRYPAQDKGPLVVFNEFFVIIQQKHQ